MKKLFILFLAVMLLVACADSTKEPAVVEDDETVKIEAPVQDESLEEPIVEEPITEPAKEESQDMSIEEVTELIEYNGVGVDDKLVSVTFENEEIKAVIKMAPDARFSAEDLAVTRYSQLSDELLDHEGWQTLTIDYVGVGTISMNRMERESNEYGDYFPTMEIENRLK